MRRRIAAVAACAMVMAVAGGCAIESRTSITPAQSQAINGRYKEASFYLASSCYYSDFFGDSSYYLVTPYPPETLSRGRAPDGMGKALYPDGWVRPKQVFGILPAGTKVNVEKVVFPDPDAFIRRPVTSPRWFPWLYLTFESREAKWAQKPFILIVEVGKGEGEEIFNKRTGAFLTSEDPTPWLNGLADATRRAILEKRVLMGMTPREVETALGPARAVTGYEVGAKQRELWNYSDGRMYLFEQNVLQNEESLSGEVAQEVLRDIEAWQTAPGAGWNPKGGTAAPKP